MTKTDSIHQESIDFISNNINAPTSEIPKHLLEYWHTPIDFADYVDGNKDFTPFAIFLYAYDTYCRNTLGKEIHLSSLDTMAKFGTFQLLIATALGKETDCNCNSVELFDFHNYNSLNIIPL